MPKSDADLLLALETNGRAARFLAPRTIVAITVAFVFIAAGLGTWLMLDSPEPAPEVASMQPEVESFFTSSNTRDVYAGFDTYEGLGPRPMPICGSGRPENCVVDGESFWLNGENIRIANIDAPQLDGRCLRETARAREARATLQQHLDNQPIEIKGKGRDNFGRVLAEIRTPKGDVGTKLIHFQVAVKWKGREEPVETWCGG